jgi:glycosyltransferase involved in cell wall biosynthesis
LLLSFVIPTYNRAGLLPQLVSALASQQTAEGVTYEAIFVDNGSTDSTPALLNQAARQYPNMLRYIRIAPTGGPSAPRNIGIRAAAGDALIIIDDDFIPDPDLVLRYAEFHNQFPDQHHAAVGATYLPDTLRADPMSVFCEFDYGEIKTPERVDYLHFWTRNVSLKTEFMLRAGMFDESFLYYEDVLCGYRMAKAGLQLHFWRVATGQHLQQTTLQGLPIRYRFMGRWMYKFLEAVEHDPTALIRLNVSPTAPAKPALLQLNLKRTLFRALAHPAVAGLLGKLIAGSRRSPLTDRLYLAIAKENAITGYREAQRNAAEGRPMDLLQLHSKLADRGDR